MLKSRPALVLKSYVEPGELLNRANRIADWTGNGSNCRPLHPGARSAVSVRLSINRRRIRKSLLRVVAHLASTTDYEKRLPGHREILARCSNGRRREVQQALDAQQLRPRNNAGFGGWSAACHRSQVFDVTHARVEADAVRTGYRRRLSFVLARPAPEFARSWRHILVILQRKRHLDVSIAANAFFPQTIADNVPASLARGSLALTESQMSGGICAGGPGFIQCSRGRPINIQIKRVRSAVDAAVLQGAVARVVRG